MGMVFLLQWSMVNTANISGALHVSLTGIVLFWKVNLGRKKYNFISVSGNSLICTKKILSLSLFHPHAVIIFNSLRYQQHMTVLLNTVCPYEAFSGSPDDSYCQRQISTVDTMHIQ